MNRFNIALSFAGETRHYVSEVAHQLAQKFGREGILYDKFHEAEFARRNLGIYLPKLYHEESDLIVVIVSPEYDPKQWTGLEWIAIHDLLSQKLDHMVMLCRFQKATVDGLYSTSGFVELDNLPADHLTELILKRYHFNQINPRIQGLTLSDGRSKVNLGLNTLPRVQIFVGRKTELSIIEKSLSDSSVWGIQILGSGGIGKTSLAIYSAELLTSRFTNILFFSAKGEQMDDDGKRLRKGFALARWKAILDLLARQFGNDEISKAPENERAVLLCQSLSGSNSLLIFDNLEDLSSDDRSDMVTFLEHLPKDCKAVLTSRFSIGTNIPSLYLKEFDYETFLQFFAKLEANNKKLPHISELQYTEFYKKTFGNPLLIRWVAGQVGRQNRTTIEDALTFLGQCPSANDPVNFILGDLFSDLNENETRILAALYYLTQAVDINAISEISKVQFEDTVNLLKRLSNIPLITSNKDEIRYSILPLVSEYLARKTPSIIKEIGEQLEVRAFDLIMTYGGDKFENFALLDAAWPTIAPALKFIISGPNSRLQIVCEQLGAFLNFTGRWDERLSLSEQAETVALAADDFQNAGWLAYESGYIRYLRGEAEEVIECSIRAEQYWSHLEHNKREIGYSIRLKAFGLKLKGNYFEAFKYLSQTLELWQSEKTVSRDIAICLNDLGDLDRVFNNLKSAKIYYQHALVIAEETGYVEGIMYIKIHLALLGIENLEFQLSESLATEALPVAETLGRKESIAEACYCLTQVLIQKGNFQEASIYAWRALKIYAYLNSPFKINLESIIKKYKL